MFNEANEHYYQFESGVIFKVDSEMNFYILNDDGSWSLEPRLISIFFDAASDYKEITYETDRMQRK